MREKLIEILRCQEYGHHSYEEVADYLISQGVTVQEPTQESKGAAAATSTPIWTNYDKLKTMSLGDVAQLLCDMHQCHECPFCDDCSTRRNGARAWLVQEAQ